mgnify:CR=1 FL=1
MSSYKEIVGQKITKVSSDPSNVETGQMWYNSATGSLRALGLVEAWSSTTSMGTSRYGHGAAGNKGGGIVASGRPPSSGPAAMVTAEEYDGSGWRATNNITTGRFFAGNSFGTETASVFAGGFSPSAPNMIKTELYDGSSFSETGDLSESKYAAINAGTTTAGLLAGGSPGRTSTEEFGGSSWTSGNATNTALEDRTGLGTQTAAIGMGGAAPPGTPFATTETEFYDGTSWTIGASMNQSRRRGSGGGTQTAGLVYGGLVPGPAATNKSEFYDGTSWSTNANMGTSRYYGYGNSSGGTFAVGNVYVAGGLTSPGAPNHTTAAEEYNRSTNTITAAAWAASNNMNTGSYNPAALVGGTQTAVIAAGGDTGGPAYSTTKSEQYDGSSWTATPTLNTARAAGTGTGTSTASIVFGAYPPSNAPATESWNGSSWTTTPATVGAPMERAGGSGTQTAALAFAYYNRPANTNPTTVYSYNGSAWTTSPSSMNTGRYGGSGLGTQTAALAMGGVIVSSGQSAAVEQWDGSSWTTKTSVSSARGYAGASGISTSAIFFGGNPGSPTTATEGWDGTSWYSRPSLATARGGIGSSGTSADAGIGYGGGSYLAATEEFTGETSAANIANFETS